LGDATKKGFGVFGNLIKIIGVFKEEAVDVIKNDKRKPE